MSPQNKIILLIEDNRDDEELVRMAFEENHLINEIVTAHDGLEALDYLFGRGPYSGRDTSIQPQLILLDLKLPKMGGFEVLNALRADPRTRLIPVVVLTTSSQDEDKSKSYTLGANSYIRKPVQFEQFVKAAGALGLYWMVWNESPPAAASGLEKGTT